MGQGTSDTLTIDTICSSAYKDSHQPRLSHAWGVTHGDGVMTPGQTKEALQCLQCVHRGQYSVCTVVTNSRSPPHPALVPSLQSAILLWLIGEVTLPHLTLPLTPRHHSQPAAVELRGFISVHF